MYTNINSVSPLKHDYPMLDGAMRLAKRGQPVVVTPFTLAGAMAPVTMAGAVTLSLAEALAAIALLQYIAPGCPVAIGTFTSNVDAEIGCACLWHPGIHACDADDRTDGAPLQGADAVIGGLRL